MIQLDTSWLQHVQKPARYTGGEYNSIVKDHSTVDVTMALAFPDVYEVAMSHLGIKILYGLVNRRDDAAAERVCTLARYGRGDAQAQHSFILFGNSYAY